MFDSILQLLSKIFFFTSYYQKASYPKPLAVEEEAKYLQKWLNNKDIPSRDKLIEHNLRLVAHISKKYQQNNDIDDLISVGNIGLIKGINTYSADKGTVLVTYLARCIENEILMMLRSNKRYKNTVYLQEAIGIDNEGNEYSLMDVLAIKDENVFKQVELGVLKIKLNEVMLQTLNNREYTIMQYRFPLNNAAPLTQLQTAAKLKISRSYISRIETKALEKIRKVLEYENLN